MSVPVPADDADAAHAHAYRRHQVQTLVLATVAFAASAPGQSFLISVFVDDFLVGTGLSRTTFSTLYAAGTVMSAAAMVWVGRLVDRQGLRATWFLVAGALVLATLLASIANGALLAFVALALLRTSGQGSFTLLGTLLVARTFERRRGQAVAVANLGLTFTSIALPPLVAFLIVSTDWRTAYRALAVALLVLVLPLGALLRAGPHRRVPNESHGHQPAEFPSAVRVTRPRLPNIPTLTTATLLLVLAAPPLIGTAVTFHAVSILGSRGIEYLAAGGVIGLLGATSAVGVLIAGALVDRLSTRSSLLLPTLAVLLGSLALLVPATWTAYTAFAVLGLGMGSVGVVNGTVWARTFGTAQLGHIQGIAQSSMITAAAVAPLIPALSLSLTSSHQPGIITLALVAAAATLLARYGRVGGERSIPATGASPA